MSTIRNTPSGRSAPPDPCQDLRRLSLVVDRVEGGDEVEPIPLRQVRHVACLEARVGQPQALGLVAPRLGTLLREVVADEPAVGKDPGHQINGMASTTADVGHLDASPEPLRQARDQGEDGIDQGGVVDSTALFDHELLEAGVGSIRDAPAVAEAGDNLVLDLGQEGNVLCLQRQVVGAGGPGQPSGVLGRESVGLGDRVVVHHPASGHGAKPLPDVAFMQAGRLGQLGTG